MWLLFLLASCENEEPSTEEPQQRREIDFERVITQNSLVAIDESNGDTLAHYRHDMTCAAIKYGTMGSSYRSRACHRSDLGSAIVAGTSRRTDTLIALSGDRGLDTLEDYELLMLAYDSSDRISVEPVLLFDYDHESYLLAVYDYPGRNCTNT